MMAGFFPSRTITFYMAWMFLTRSFGVLLALVLILQSLDMLGQTGKIMAFPGNGTPEIMRYVSLRMPQIIEQFLPFSILLGTLVTLMTLNANSEIISMKAAGLSAHQVLAPLIVASILVAGLSFAFNDRIVTRATTALEKWQRVNYGKVAGDSKAQVNIWVRDGDNLINAETVAGRGAATRLTGVTIYSRTGDELNSIVSAERGKPAAGGWELEGARRFDVVKGTEAKLGTISVGAGIRPDQFTLASVKASHLTFSALWQAIGDLKRAGRRTSALEAGMWHKISGPLSSVLMPLLAAVAAFGVARSGGLLIRAVIGMALGFGYFVADNFGLAMGNLGVYPPLLAAWGPFFIFLLVGETVLMQTEE
ncbi:MAG: LPS export ABC transporter permease LptG [Sphingomonadaceae bacterium]